MDRQDFEFEELMISEPIGLPLHGFDLVIRPLQPTRGDPVIVVGQQALAMRRQRVGERRERLDLRGLGPSDPVVQKRFGFLFVVLRPELAQLGPPEPFPERSQRITSLAVADKDHRTTVQVQNDR